jgi:hypothetical protein
VNFINLTVFFLTLMLVPADVTEVGIDTGVEEFHLTRSEPGGGAWTYYIGDDRATPLPISSNGRTMNVRDKDQQTINFMDQYLQFTTNTVWEKTDVIAFKALDPPSPIQIKRSGTSIEIIHDHEKHPFHATVTWAKPTKKEAAE